MKIILKVLLILILLAVGYSLIPATSRAEKYQPEWVISNNWYSHVAIIPFPIWGLVGNGKGYDWELQCWVMPFERYTTYPTMQGVNGLVMVQKGRGCWGYAER
jgi:hypothetical protein